jgi:hypothetical protein
LGRDFDLVVVPGAAIAPYTAIAQGQADIGCRKTGPIGAVVCDDVFRDCRASYYRRE